MINKILIYSLISLFLVLFQNSFLVHFDIRFNFVLLLVLAINLFENPKQESGLIIALASGFFLDVFSGYYFGFYILVLTFLSLVIKFILARYVRYSLFKKA